MSVVYLSLGTNLDDKKKNISIAVDKIQELIGKRLSLSALYKTKPWGYSSDNMYVNAAISIETKLTPQQVLTATQRIEREMGRTKKSVNGQYSDRIIDIDILLYDNMIIKTPELTIPHPLMTKRMFVMQPLSEIAPDLIIPEINKNIKTIINESNK
jgi:2-amino-4-hydroxy-6-hydroxymethyldihydropteridine diphosphokinase